jgi:hypothetical protein
MIHTVQLTTEQLAAVLYALYMIERRDDARFDFEGALQAVKPK